MPPGGGRVLPLRRPRVGLWVLLAFVALSLLGQAVPLYTDWLWFQEVGFTTVFTTRLTLSGWLFMGLGGAVFVFLFVNLSLAARTAPPDVLWELEDQLGLPGRAILEPLVRRLRCVRDSPSNTTPSRGGASTPKNLVPLLFRELIRPGDGERVLANGRE